MAETEKSTANVIIKGVQVKYLFEYYVDSDDKNEYTNAELDTRNLNRAINAYWVKIGKPENIVNDLNSEPKFP